MATLIPDMSRPPKAMLVSLINNDNNLNLTIDNVLLSNCKSITPVTSGGVTRNTSIDIDILNDELDNNFVTFKYARVDLGVLFSAITPMILETTVPIGIDGLPTDMPLFINEIKRKFKILFDEIDFTYAPAANSVVVTAGVSNCAYTGSCTVNYMPVLNKRVATKLLDGFKEKTILDLNDIVKKFPLVPRNHPSTRPAESLIPMKVHGTYARFFKTVTHDDLPTVAKMITHLSAWITWTCNEDDIYASLYNAKITNDIEKGRLRIKLDPARNNTVFGSFIIDYDVNA